MKRVLFFLFLMGVGLVSLYAQKSALKFNEAGEFKIVQFTDVHFKYGNPASDIALERIDEVLKAERPDLVVLTGDVIYAKPADKGMRTVLERVSAHNVPFVVTFGNHDDEQGMTRTQLYDIIRSVPGCLMPDRGEQASPDYTLTVQSSGKPCRRALFLRLPFLFQIEGCEGVRLVDVRSGGELPPPERCVYGG